MSGTAVPAGWGCPGDLVSAALRKLAWYEPVHRGWRFRSYAGPGLLDRAARDCGVRSHSRILLLGADVGETGRYLSARHGAALTGLETEAARIRHARRRAGDLPPRLRRRLRFVHATPAGWCPETRYDVVLGSQATEAGAGLPAVVRLAHEALRPGGRFCLTEVVRNRRPGAFRARRQPPEPLDGPVLRAGFAEVRFEDVSDEAVCALRTAQLTLVRRHGEVLRAAGPAAAAALLDGIETAIGGLRDGGFGLWRMTATRPRRPPGCRSGEDD